MTKGERENWQREMFSLIKKWQKSGISQKDFSDRHDLPTHVFYYWLRKYKQAIPSSNSGFVPIEIGSPLNDTREEIQIQYPNGVMVTLDKAVSLSRIRALVNMI